MEYSANDPRNPTFVSAEDAHRQHEDYEFACRVAGSGPREITRGREMTIEDMRDCLRDPGIPERYAGIVVRALGAMSGVWSRESRVRTVGQWLDATLPKPDVRKFVEFIAEIN